MAIRNSMQLPLGAARLFAGSLSQLNTTMPESSSRAFSTLGDKEESNKGQSLSPVALQQHVREQTSGMRLGLKCNGPMLPARRMMPSFAAGPLSTQRRAYNAWAPAQRYFVEGEHVIAAEADRTFQFTGLDSGSFYPYVIFTAIATAISCVFMVLPLIVAPSRVDLDKSSAYECGFDAFGEARQTFSVSFYLVSIMYLLFDIEIAYLFPYAMSHASVPMFWTMQTFLAILVGGFCYEWGMGALEWRE